MPAKDLGTKHTCWKCGTKFYDLKKPAAICPKCGANAREAPVTRSPAAAEKRAKPKEKVVEPVETVEEPEVEEELDEALDDESDDDDA